MRRRALAAVSVVLLAVVGTGVSAPGRDDTGEVTRLATLWVEAVSTRDPAGFDMLSHAGKAYYPRMRQLALSADAEALQLLHTADQLQVLLLRGMLEPAELRSMSDPALFRFALEQGFIGANLRSADVLREVVAGSNEAHGRLFKFGLDARPERGLQYFVREQDEWRVELRGELERMRRDFDAFAARSGLSKAEAAFLILEMRLMRKVTPADFLPTGAPAPGPRAAPSWTAAAATPELRLVAVRRSLDSDRFVATIEDRAESLRYLLEAGDPVPPAPNVRLLEVRFDAVVLETNHGVTTLWLDRDGPPLNHRAPRTGRLSSRSLLDIATQGSERDGMMAQWRNVGLRDRPLLLQQAWLTPVHEPHSAAGEGMRGLRVRKLTEGSFWNQLGAEPGDLLTAVNDRPLDSMDAWQELLEIAQNDQTITITLERDARRLRFETRTIQPR